MTQDEFLIFAAMMESSFVAEKHEWNDDELFDSLMKNFYGQNGSRVFKLDMHDMYENLREKAKASLRGK